MPDANWYLVTKHYGSGIAHVFGMYPSLKDAEAIAEMRSHGKGHFKGKAYVRIWKLESEIEVADAKRN